MLTASFLCVISKNSKPTLAGGRLGLTCYTDVRVRINKVQEGGFNSLHLCTSQQNCYNFFTGIVFMTIMAALLISEAMLCRCCKTGNDNVGPKIAAAIASKAAHVLQGMHTENKKGIVVVSCFDEVKTLFQGHINDL